VFIKLGVLYGCKILPLTLREVYKVYGNQKCSRKHPDPRDMKKMEDKGITM
jgi:hypothetical protein